MSCLRPSPEDDPVGSFKIRPWREDDSEKNSPWRTIHLYKTFKNNNFASSAPLLVKPNV